MKLLVNSPTSREWSLIYMLASCEVVLRTDYMLMLFSGAQTISTYDVSTQQYSTLLSIYSVFACAATVFGIFFLDQFDRKKALVGSCLGFGIGLFIGAMATDFFMLSISRAILGIFNGMMSILILTIIGDEIPYEKRGKAIGFLGFMDAMAGIIGLGGGLWLMDEFSFRLPFAILLGLMILAILRIIPALSLQGSEEKRPWKLKELNFLIEMNSLKALLFNFSFRMGHFAIVPLISIFLTYNMGYSEREVLLTFLVGGVLIIPTSLLIGKLSDQLGSGLVFQVSSVLLITTLFLFTGITFESFWVYLCVFALFFVATAACLITNNTLMTAVVSAEKRGKFLSARAGSSQLAHATAPLLVSVLLVEGVHGEFLNLLLIGVIAALFTVIAALLSRRLKLV